MSGHYWVYLLASRSRVLYVGVTSHLEQRIHQHKTGAVIGFTSRYAVNQLVFLEECGRIEDAIAREKQIKGWSRAKKIALIEMENPEWVDLAEAWFR